MLERLADRLTTLAFANRFVLNMPMCDAVVCC